MMVDHHLLALGMLHQGGKCVDSLQCVEVEAENKVGTLQQVLHRVFVLGVDIHVFCTRKECQRARRHIGSHHVHRLAERFKRVHQS